LDAEFYKFNGKRLAKDYLSNTEDVQRHSLSAIATYWWLFLIFLSLMILSYWLFPKLLRWSKVRESGLGLPSKGALSLLMIGLSVLAIRGGFQFKPISLVSAYVQGSQELGALVLNTPFVFIKGHPSDLSSAPVFVPDREESLRIISVFRGGRESSFEKVDGIENVVVLVIESLSLEYTGLVPGQPSYTPFLDQLASSSLVFANNYANGRRSIEAMPSIFCGLPSLVSAPIITSALSQNELHCLPEVFKTQGFETFFFHGAHNGSFHMDAFAAKAGFDHFIGFNEFPTSDVDSDGHWGILDEPMLQYMASKLSAQERPFFAGVFTLSSHHPYFIPESLRDRFKEGPLEIHKSIGYADYSLMRFFETAKTKDWFPKTLFVITGDHTQKNSEPTYQIFTGNYRVPLVIYSENQNFKDRFLKHKNSYFKKVSQAVDIPMTLLKSFGIKPEVSWPPFGGNALDLEQKGLAVNFDGFQYWLRADNAAIGITKEGQISQQLELDSLGFSLKDQEREKGLLEDQGASKRLEALRALVSFFNQSMRQNSVYKSAEGAKKLSSDTKVK